MEANDMEVASFAFHRSYHDTLEALPDGQRLALSDAIRAYAFEGQQPTFTDPMLDIVWGLMAPNISASVRKSASKAASSSRRPELTKKQRFMILERDGFRCRYCGRSSDETMLEVDHIIPVSKGGSNDPENLVTACFECNNGKRAHVIGEPREWSR